MRRVVSLGLVCVSMGALTSVAMAQAGARDTPPAGRDGTGSGAPEEEDIVVVGQKPRGSVVGDIQPEITLNAGDVRALGVSSISDLLTELAPQLTSARGGAPVVLLEGRRVSSFREIATIPPEAIQRVEILPEEVALKYGYPASQKVMNIVLRPRFKAVTAEAKDRIATDGGANQAEGQAGLLTIRRGTRVNLNVDYQRTAALAESARGIVNPNTGADTLRSLSPSQRSFTLNGTYARALTPKLDVSLNGELDVDRSYSLIGLSTLPGLDAFERTAKDLTASLGSTVNYQGSSWRAALTTTYVHDEGRTFSVRGTPADIATNSSDTATADLTVNGSIYRLPAGDLSVTAHLGGTVDSFNSQSVRASGSNQVADLDRTIGVGGLSLDVPLVKSPSRLIGRISVNANVDYQNLSDFGGLTTYGFGLNWAPVKAVGLIASYRDTDAAPTMQQLGNPQIATSNVPVFDYRTGQSVLVTQVSGGNPGLLAPETREWRLGLTVKPLAGKDLTLTVDYNNARTVNGIIALPAATAAIQDAFPDRFVRDNGTLTRVIGTPINIAQQDSEILRWGINFSKRLKTPKSQMDQLRAAFEKRMQEQIAAGRSPFGGPPDGHPPVGGPGGPGGFGGFGGPGGGARGPGGGGGPGGGNRLTFAVYHSWHLKETAVLRDGLPQLNLLDGGTIGSGAGLPRHEVEMQAGVTHSGFGLRLTGKWQSPTHVDDATGATDLRFSGLTTFNLRLFANPAQVPGLIGKYRWMRGMRVSLVVNNLFNERQRVTDASGNTPYAYQPGYLDPLGRTVMISVRKIFF